MRIETNIKLEQAQVVTLLKYFDDSSDTPLSKGLDFESYGKKLSDFAYFVIAYEDAKMIGFIAYYLNEEGRFAYVPQVVVHKDGRHRGVGHALFEALTSAVCTNYDCIKLEVLKTNKNARLFYAREGFVEIEDHNERFLLVKKFV